MYEGGSSGGKSVVTPGLTANSGAAGNFATNGIPVGETGYSVDSVSVLEIHLVVTTIGREPSAVNFEVFMPAFLQNEQFGFAILVAGIVVATIGYLWLILRAFRTSTGWGIATLIVPVIGPLAFLSKHFPRAKSPVTLVLLGFVLVFLPLAINAAFGEKQAQHALQRTTGGMKEFTATNAVNPDYDAISVNSDLTTVQAARADFTDEVAERLRGLTKLKTLDLSDSTITDKSLAIIATLPTLEKLSLARVKDISEAGFQDTILKMPSLKEIDVRGTVIKVETLRAWRAVGTDRKTNPK